MSLITTKVLALLSTALAIMALWCTSLPWYAYGGQSFFINGEPLQPPPPPDDSINLACLFVLPTVGLLVLNLIAYALAFLKQSPRAVVLCLLFSLVLCAVALLPLLRLYLLPQDLTNLEGPAFATLALTISLVAHTLLLFSLRRRRQ